LQNHQIVSVVVLCFNSENTIIATLNSISEQKFNLKNIELVISDDASVDATRMLLEDWISCNKKRFHSVIDIYHSNNIGTVKNLDNAYKRTSGEWIKVIAGDDLLTENCISDYIMATKMSENRAFLSYMQTFSEDNGSYVKQNILPPENQAYLLMNGSVDEQKKFLLNSSFSATPSLFIAKSLLEEIGYLDGNFFLMEDYPLWIKINNFGEKIGFLPKITVLYRVQESVSRSKKRIVNLTFLNDMVLLEKRIIKNLNPFTISYFRRKIWLLLYPLVVTIFNNERNFRSRGAIFLVNLLFKPKYVSALLKKLRSRKRI